MANLRTSGPWRVAILALGVAFLCGLASHAGAQATGVPNGVANCVWLRLKTKATGFEDSADASALGPKRSISTDCYMQLVYMDVDASNPHGRYGAPILCPINADEWQASVMEASFSGKAYGDGKVLAEDNYLAFANEAGDVVQGYGTHLLQISVDPKTLLFKKAIFTTLGAEMIDESIFFESFKPVKGSYLAKGTSVTPDKVPPQAKALVAGGPCPQ
jgi:hypothetical protein